MSPLMPHPKIAQALRLSKELEPGFVLRDHVWMKILLGQTLHFDGDPFTDPTAARHDRRGAVVIADGLITASGPADELLARFPRAEVLDMGESLLMAGFIDAHVHYPQTAIIASWGKRLIDWLNDYTFPEEAQFHDAAYAAHIADQYFDLVLANGTTSTASYCTIHTQSVDAYFTAAQARGMRVVGGKTCMNRNAPDTLRDTAQTSYDDSKALLERWHGVDRLGYAITPRFAPTSSPEQLRALGALWSENPDCLMQTHLSEQVEEIAWVKDLFPGVPDYLATYETHGLVGTGAVMGHAIHLEHREIAVMAELDMAVVHCPTSNAFIGSGLCDVAGLHAAGVRIGLATDTGGGSSFSMLRTMAAAYEIAQLRGVALHPSQLIWLATLGSSRALRLDHRIGNLKAGMEADIIALDLASTPAIAQRHRRATDIWEAVFPTIMMGDDRAVRQVWVGGKAVKQDARR